jgi:hypothetical protein
MKKTEKQGLSESELHRTGLNSPKPTKFMMMMMTTMIMMVMMKRLNSL